MASFQSTVSDGRPISRIVSAPRPASSTNDTAAVSTRSLLSGAREPGLGVGRVGTGIFHLVGRRTGRGFCRNSLTNLQRKCHTYNVSPSGCRDEPEPVSYT